MLLLSETNEKNKFMICHNFYVYLSSIFNHIVWYLYFRFNDISTGVRTVCVQYAQRFILHHTDLVKDIIGEYHMKMDILLKEFTKFSLTHIEFCLFIFFK